MDFNLCYAFYMKILDRSSHFLDQSRNTYFASFITPTGPTLSPYLRFFFPNMNLIIKYKAISFVGDKAVKPKKTGGTSWKKLF